MRRLLLLPWWVACTTDPQRTADAGADTARRSQQPTIPPDSGRVDTTLPPERRTCSSITLVERQHIAGLIGELDVSTAQNTLPGPGLAVGDLTGDGHLDVVLARPGAPALLFAGDGTGQLTATDRVLPMGSTVTLGLLNDDRHLDLLLAGAGQDMVLLSDTTGALTPAALPGGRSQTTTLSVADLDQDGDLDLFLPTHRWPADLNLVLAGDWDSEGHYVLLNDGTGQFTEHPGLEAERHTLAFHGAPVDFDLDGDLDIYLNNDFGSYTGGNQMLENHGAGTLTARAGDGTDLPMFAMGTSVGDLNRDAHPDLVVSNIGTIALLNSLGDGTFAESAAAYGLADLQSDQRRVSWGQRLVDLDGDGYDDLVVGFSRVPAPPIEADGPDVGGGVDTEPPPAQQDLIALYRPQTERFTAAADDGHDTTAFEGDHGTKPLVVADLDDDGRPEIIKAGYRSDFTDLDLRVYDITGGCGPGVTLRLPMDAHGVGARVEASVDGIIHTRWMLPSTLYGSSAAEVYIGLGEASVADRIEVTLSSGTSVQFDAVQAGSLLAL